MNTKTSELIFQSLIGKNMWLAIGLSDNFVDADIIQWITGESQEPEKLKEESKIFDHIAIKGVLLTSNTDSYLENVVNVDERRIVNFTTWRPFQISDELHTQISLQNEIPLIFASGPTAATEWKDRTEHGKISLVYSLEGIGGGDDQNGTVPDSSLNTDQTTQDLDLNDFQERRIPEYETHGWWTLIAWFPLGYALVASKRYFKT